VNTVAQPLGDYSVSNSPGTKLSYFGYEFEVPWKASVKEEKLLAGWVLLSFDSGQHLTFIVPSDQNGLLSELVQDPSLNMGYMQPILGDLTKRSAYDQYATLLDMTPGSVHAFGRRSDAVRGVTLLTVKLLAFGPGLESAAYSFQLPGKRGFQIGNPQKAKRVDIEIFDSTGTHIEILCWAPNGKQGFSQPEINRITTSLRSASNDTQIASLKN
jgi:hypothetical protein